ncbi:MAG: vgr related protein [Sphingobium sp.]
MPAHVPPNQERPLSDGERRLARAMFGGAIDLDAVMLRWRKWWLFQPRRVTMAPRGHIHFHPAGQDYRDCFTHAPLALQAHLIHELVHVWQHQQGINLLLRRHPFCRYSYAIRPGWSLDRYGIEQQAEIVRHIFLLRHGVSIPGAPPLPTLESILPFRPD